MILGRPKIGEENFYQNLCANLYFLFKCIHGTNQKNERYFYIGFISPFPLFWRPLRSYFQPHDKKKQLNPWQQGLLCSWTWWRRRRWLTREIECCQTPNGATLSFKLASFSKMMMNKDCNWAGWLTFHSARAVWFTKKIFWKSWEYHFQDYGQHELWWMDPVLSDLLIFQYSEQKAPKALLTDSAIVSPRLYLHKNRERHFLILKECTENFCANNVNQMHKENFIINYRRHSSLNAEVALQLSWRFATKL